MADMNPDPPLNTFLDGRWGAPQQGLPAPMWVRHPTVVVSGGGPMDVLVVNDCTAPVMTQACVEARDFEQVLLCDPVTGQPVMRVTNYTCGVIPCDTYHTLDRLVWLGDPSTLTVCADRELESDPLIMCDDGTTTFNRWVVKENGVPNGQFFDTDLAAAPYVPMGTLTIGACVPAAAGGLTYFNRLIGTLDVAAIIAATSAVNLLTISVTQISGTGTVTPDAGGGGSLLTGESMDWSARAVGIANLNASTLTFDSGDGEMHVTALYTL